LFEPGEIERLLTVRRTDLCTACDH